MVSRTRAIWKSWWLQRQVTALKGTAMRVFFVFFFRKHPLLGVMYFISKGKALDSGRVFGNPWTRAFWAKAEGLQGWDPQHKVQCYRVVAPRNDSPCPRLHPWLWQSAPSWLPVLEVCHLWASPLPHDYFQGCCNVCIWSDSRPQEMKGAGQGGGCCNVSSVWRR